MKAKINYILQKVIPWAIIIVKYAMMKKENICILNHRLVFVHVHAGS